ncbi:MAG TPA: hypothetical protein VK932_30850 [Kofleriaceae bacterium]|nr:hypothetical protein [Kofleriaceae bacterium]
MKERHGAAPIAHHLEKRAGAETRPKKRSALALDLLDLLEPSRPRDRRLVEAFVVIATQANARVLAAISTVVSLAASKARTAR